LIPQLSPADLARWRADATRAEPLLVDVREPWEFDVCHIAGSRLVSLGQLPAHVDELPRDRPLVLVCHHGNRSHHAAAWLQRLGFTDVHNLRGGVAAWAAEVDPAMPTY
jgi:rhodanese-related sulfurtransferase